MHFYKHLLIGVFLINALLGFGQTTTTGIIKGYIEESDGNAAAFATVSIKETAKSVLTEADGTFKLEHPAGEYTLQVQLLSHETYSAKIRVFEGQTTELHKIKLTETDRHLKEVEVIGKTKAQEVKESSYTVNVVDLKTYANTTTDLNQVLNRTTGVKVREEAGMGSNFNFSLNGFSGKQVKFFLDGVPMDNFGSALTLNNIPVNLAERIEVYKGVVPIWLGSDALGGAINIVTNQNTKSFADISYSYGSFNTHRASLNSRYVDSTGFILNTNAFYNYSDNNYLTYVESYDLNTNKTGPEKPYRRFHDGYKSGSLQIEGGLTNKKFTDKLLIGLNVSGNKKEIQTGMNMQQAIGEAYTTSASIMPTIKYKKNDFLIEDLVLTVYGSYNYNSQMNVDTSSNDYNWEGKYVTATGLSALGGEIGDKTLFKYTDQNFLTTTNLSYTLTQKSSIGLSHTFNRFRRQGSDEAATYAIAFENPNILRKHVLGVAYYYSSLNKRLTGTAFAKYFQQKVHSTEVSGYDQIKTPVSTSKNYPGYGIAFAYFLTPKIQLKTSFESTYRLPDELELMGNGLTYLANMTLKPEQSNNINFGGLSTFKLNNHQIDFEVGFIYRNTHNFIRPKATGGPTISYDNLGQVMTTGVDGGLKYSYKSIFFLSANGTYQNLRSANKMNENGTKNFNYLDRIPNKPYLFGNADIGMQFHDIVGKGDNVCFNIGINYVHSFYLFWPKQGSREGKHDIPAQLTQNAGFTYSLKNGRYNFTLECNNIGDIKVYDNFKLQKPGRAYYAKFRMLLHK